MCDERSTFAMVDSIDDSILKTTNSSAHVSAPVTINNNNSDKLRKFISTDARSHVVTDFLTAKDLVVISRTSKDIRSFAAIHSALKRYAECIVNDQPAPAEIKDISSNVIKSTEIAENTKSIVTHILKHNGGIIHREKPLPPFLVPFFRAVTPAELDDALQQPFLNKSIPRAAKLHMKMCGTFWVKNEASTELLINLVGHLMNARAESYITIGEALTLPADAPMPKHIVATHIDLQGTNEYDKINALLTTYPEHELVIDFDKLREAHLFQYTTHTKSLPSSLGRISFVGKNLKTVSPAVLHKCDLSSITLPNSIEIVGNFFCCDCESLTYVTIPNSVTDIGSNFLLKCPSLISVTIPRRFQNSVRHLPSTVQIIFNDDMGTLENNDIGTLEIDKNLGRNDAI